MKSKTQYFNHSLIFDTLKKKWWFFVINFIALLFTRPVPYMLGFSSLKQRNFDLFNASQATTLTQEKLVKLLDGYADRFFLTGGYYAGLMVILIIFSVLASLVMFSYLHNKREVNFYHSLPIRRESYFAANYITGALAVIVPYLAVELITLLCAGVTGIFGYIDAGAYALTIVAAIIMFMVVYTIAVLSAMLSGNVFSHICGIVVLNFGVFFCVMIHYLMMDTFFETFYSYVIDDIVVRISPYVYMVYMAATEISGPMLLTYALITVALFFLCVRLYKRRASEKATCSLVFDKTKPYFEYIIVLWGAAFLGLFFKEISGIPFMIFGFIAGGFVAHMTCEVAFEKDFKAMMRHKKGFLIFCLIFGVYVSLFAFDMVKYDSYVPNIDDVQTASIEDNNNMVYYYSGGLTNKDQGVCYNSQKGIAQVIAIAQASIDYNQSVRDEDDNRNTISLIIGYKKAPFGLATYRHYYIPISQIQKEYEAVYDSAEYKNRIMEQLGIISASDINDVSVESAYQQKNVFDVNREKQGFSEEKVMRLVNAYISDLKNNTFSDLQQYDLAFTIRLGGDYYGEYETDQKRFSRANLSVYENYTNTIKVLKEEFGVEDFSVIKQEFIDHIDYVRIVDNTKESDVLLREETAAVTVESKTIDQDKGIKITDKEQIRQIMQSVTIENDDTILTEPNYDIYVISNTDDYYNQYYDTYTEEKNGVKVTYSSVHFSFREGKIPQFLAEQLLKK